MVQNKVLILILVLVLKTKVSVLVLKKRFVCITEYS